MTEPDMLICGAGGHGILHPQTNFSTFKANTTATITYKDSSNKEPAQTIYCDQYATCINAIAFLQENYPTFGPTLASDLYLALQLDDYKKPLAGANDPCAQHAKNGSCNFTLISTKDSSWKPNPTQNTIPVQPA